jgi:uncharacterized protein (TIGR02466 family)|tara:strand:- start:757 stop:1308 length:552 start_codon:yes stop_codon:yes gene_type:complete
MIRTDLFATPIWQGPIKLNNDLLVKFFNKAKELNYLAKNKSSVNGSEQTEDIAISKEFSDTKKRIEYMYYQETGNKVNMGNAWICKNIKGSMNEIHVHGNTDISGVYYIETPENCGGLVFRNPNDCVQMGTRHFEKDLCWMGSYIIPAEKGKIVFFPAHLPHRTQINQNEKPRLALSFNLRYI